MDTSLVLEAPSRLFVNHQCVYYMHELTWLQAALCCQMVEKVPEAHEEYISPCIAEKQREVLQMQKEQPQESSLVKKRRV